MPHSVQSSMWPLCPSAERETQSRIGRRSWTSALRSEHGRAGRPNTQCAAPHSAQPQLSSRPPVQGPPNQPQSTSPRTFASYAIVPDLAGPRQKQERGWSASIERRAIYGAVQPPANQVKAKRRVEQAMQSCLSTTTSIIPSCLPVCCLNLPHASSLPSRHPVAYSVPSQLGSALRCGAVRGSATILASYTATAFEVSLHVVARYAAPSVCFLTPTTPPTSTQGRARHITTATPAPIPSAPASSLSPQAALRRVRQRYPSSPSRFTSTSKGRIRLVAKAMRHASYLTQQVSLAATREPPVLSCNAKHVDSK